jgi:CCR4-NOT transcription complex subunit 6
MQIPELKQTEDVLNRVMIKDNIATMVCLETKEPLPKTQIAVVNAHLHWDPQYKDVKLVQTAMLMQELQVFLKSLTPKGGRHPPILICGDFNSLPDSGVYEFLSTGKAAQDHADFSTYTYGEYTSRGLSHSLPLKSAYTNVDINFTNYTPGFKGVIDYVWFDSEAMTVSGVLGGVDREYMKNVVGFPNWHHPSDHIPLVVGVKLRQNVNKMRV